MDFYDGFKTLKAPRYSEAFAIKNQKLFFYQFYNLHAVARSYPGKIHTIA